MSKKLIVILFSFLGVLAMAFFIIGQINTYKGLKEVYVAKTFIRKGVKITPEMIEKKSVTLNRERTPGDKKLVSYYEDVVVNPKEVVDKYATYDILAGEILIYEKVNAKANFSDQYLYNLPKGYFAYVLNAGLEAQAGLIKANDYVDLYISSKEQGVIDEPILRHLRVYDLRSKDGVSVKDNNKNEKGEIIQAKYLVVALNDQQLRKIVYYTNKGAIIQAVMRQRPKTAYEVIDPQEFAYPPFANIEGDIIDQIREQELIDKNKIKLDEEERQKSQLKATKTKSN